MEDLKKWEIGAAVLLAILAVGWVNQRILEFYDYDNPAAGFSQYRLERLVGAINQYSSMNNALPSELTSLTACSLPSANCIPILNKNDIRDDWGGEIRYEILGDNTYRLTILGKDGAIGGAGMNKDISVLGP